MIMTTITVRADTASFAFVEYESRRDADDAYHEMHNKRIGRDDLLKIEVCRGETQEQTSQGWQRRLISFIQWARTPPSASWRFDSGRDRPRDPREGRDSRRERSPPRRSARSPSPRRRDYSPRKEDRRERYEDRRERSRSPEDRDREMKDDRREDERENGTNGDDRKGSLPTSVL
jgi:RNA recognition motif. (a.k.a. RRM, RBD, or RNP domain)